MRIEFDAYEAPVQPDPHLANDFPGVSVGFGEFLWDRLRPGFIGTFANWIGRVARLVSLCAAAVAHIPAHSLPKFQSFGKSVLYNGAPLPFFECGRKDDSVPASSF